MEAQIREEERAVAFIHRGCLQGRSSDVGRTRYAATGPTRASSFVVLCGCKQQQARTIIILIPAIAAITTIGRHEPQGSPAQCRIPTAAFMLSTFQLVSSPPPAAALQITISSHILKLVISCHDLIFIPVITKLDCPKCAHGKGERKGKSAAGGCREAAMTFV